MIKKIYFGLITIITIMAIVLSISFAVDWGVRRWQMEQKLSDTEIFNGTVSNKVAQLETVTYPCNPRTVYNPKTKTSKTIYEDCRRDVVNYSIELSFGDTLDYGTQDRSQKPPRDWQSVNIGSPASQPKKYRNYIKASDTTILKRKAFLDNYQYAKLVPEIPRVYNRIEIDQVIAINDKDGYNKYDKAQMELFNKRLAGLNGKLGESKQLNTIVILVPDYMNDMIYAIDQKWVGGNKNEVIIFINLAKDRSITRVQSLSWSTSNGDIEAKLDNILVNEVKQINNEEEINTAIDKIQSTLETTFDRKSMQDYEYLLQEVKSKYGF